MHFERAVDIRLKQGDTAANQLALLYLCIGRVYALQDNYKEARAMFSKSEALFVRTLGPEKHFMAQLVVMLRLILFPRLIMLLQCTLCVRQS